MRISAQARDWAISVTCGIATVACLACWPLGWLSLMATILLASVPLVFAIACAPYWDRNKEKEEPEQREGLGLGGWVLCVGAFVLLTIVYAVAGS